MKAGIRDINIKVLDGYPPSIIWQADNTIILSTINFKKNYITSTQTYSAIDEKGFLYVDYELNAYSKTPRIRGSRNRNVELSEIIHDCISDTIYLENYKNSRIDIGAHVIKSDGSTRAHAINAISVNLELTGLKTRGIITGITFGINHKKQIVYDVTGIEDQHGFCDVFICFDRDKKISAINLDGAITVENFLKSLNQVEKYADQTRNIQLNTIKKYKNE